MLVSRAQGIAHVTALAMAVARLRPKSLSNAVDPGWVPTRMGGSSAPDDPDAGAETQAALAIGAAGLDGYSGEYLHHMAVRDPASGKRNPDVQERLLRLCQECRASRCKPKSPMPGPAIVADRRQSTSNAPFRAQTVTYAFGKLAALVE